MRTIAGIVLANGNIERGTGDFEVRKEATGLYTITFRPRFSRVHGGATTQIFFSGGDGGNTRDNAVFVFLRDGDMRIKTGNGNGDASDRDFTFIVTGD